MTSERFLESKAFVAVEPQMPPKIEYRSIFIDLEELKDDEVVVKMTASGICHTDLVTASGKAGGEFPIVLGHEGAGDVYHLPKGYKGDLKVGDTVLCSFQPCTQCAQCDLSRVCETFIPSEMGLFPEGRREHLDAPDSGKKARSGYFSQSSLAQYGVCKAGGLVKVDKDVPLEYVAPFVCGIQTGFGTVVNTLYPYATREREWSKLPHWKEAGNDAAASANLGKKPHTSIAIFGVGAVGTAALAGAVMCGFDTIVAVDINPAKLAFAKKHGATHTIDARQEHDALVEAIKACSPRGTGMLTSFEGTGAMPAIKAGWASLAPGGKFVQVGACPPEAVLDLSLMDLLAWGKTYQGVLEGESITPVFLPYMVSLFQKGHLDIVKDMVTTYKPEQFEQALNDVHEGKSVKAVIRWD